MISHTLKYISAFFLGIFSVIGTIQAQTNIIAYEYWFDDAFDARQTRNITPVQQISLNQDVDVTTLSGDFHTLHFRFQDNLGNWSSIYSQAFAHTAPVKTIEYWYDSDFNGRKTVLFTPAMTVDAVRLLDAPLVQGGFRALQIRYGDEAGNWSPVLRHNFVYAPQENHIVGAYYWFNNGFDQKKYFAINASANPINVDSLLSLVGENLPQDSLAYLHIQFQDEAGQMSSIFSHRFDNCNTAHLTAVTPKQAGNRGTTKLTLKGYCIPQGGTVLLRKQGNDDIVGEPITMIDSRHFSSIFDLDGASKGIWDVVLKNGTEELILKEAFTIEEARFEVAVDIIGRDIIRTGRENTYQIAITNNGNYDVAAIPLLVAVTENVTLTFDNIEFISDPTSDSPFLIDSLPNLVDSLPLWHKTTPEIIKGMTNGKYIFLIVPYLTIGEIKYISLRVKSPANQTFTLQAMLGNPLYHSKLGSNKTSGNDDLLTPDEKWRFCAMEMALVIVKTAFKAVGEEMTGPIISCMADGFKAFHRVAFMVANKSRDANFSGKEQAQEFYWDYFKIAVNCAKAILPAAKLTSFAWVLWDIFDGVDDAVQLFERCNGESGSVSAQTKSVDSRASYDPNEKTGPEGVGNSNILSGLRPMNYTIHFENKDTLINGKPTLPAQKVIVLDTLDKSKFQMNTFQWGEVRIGKTVLKMTIPSDTLQLEYDMRPGKHILVRIKGTLDTVKGIISCVMESVDPISRRELEDPYDGFLPPNTVSPQGEGYITFTIQPRNDVAQGTPVRNRASIIFDNNKPILTNTYTNRFDYVKPVSQVLSAERLNDTTYQVKWKSSDVGVGVRHVTVWASANDGIYERVIINASGTEATFIGGWRKTYHLYSIAQDSVFNTEDRPDQPDFELTTREESFAIAQGVFLYQNYPNPLEETTTIRYFLSHSDTVSLEIIDLLGNIVQIPIVNRFNTAGEYAVRLSLESFSAGTYFYRLKTTNSQLVKRMILIK